MKEMKKMTFGQNDNSAVHIFMKEQVVHHYLVALPEEIGSPGQYSDLIALLNFAEEGDNIDIEINNGGGQLHTALQICNAIADTKAHVTTILNTEAHSAASIIFLSGHSNGVGKYGSMLVHEGVTGSFGKPSDVRKHMEHYTKMDDRIMRDTYEGFLSPTEIDKVMNGLELFLSDADIIDRLDKREQYFKTKYELEQSEQDGGTL